MRSMLLSLEVICSGWDCYYSQFEQGGQKTSKCKTAFILSFFRCYVVALVAAFSYLVMQVGHVKTQLTN